MNQDNQAPTTPPTALELAGVVPVENLDQFVAYLTGWHQAKVETTKKLLDVPEGTTFVVGEGAEASDVVLAGDALAGFKFGVEMALMQLGTLPFVAEMEDEAPAPDAAG